MSRALIHDLFSPTVKQVEKKFFFKEIPKCLNMQSRMMAQVKHKDYVDETNFSIYSKQEKRIEKKMLANKSEVFRERKRFGL